MARWPLLAMLILAQIGYPLTSGDARATLVVATVGLGCATSVCHAAATRGWRVLAVLVGVTTGGGLAVEALGVATGFPFGAYDYGGDLGPRVLGVPLVVPLAWTWMAWPAWLAAGQLVSRTAARVVVAGVGLAAWDLFLDPQMVSEGYWRWLAPDPTTLPGVGGVPVRNYLAWLVVAVLMMALIATCAGARGLSVDRQSDATMLVLYLWTYFSSVLAHAVLLGLAASALWGGIGMGVVALPLAVRLVRR